MALFRASREPGFCAWPRLHENVESISVKVFEAEYNELVTERATIRSHFGQTITLDTDMLGYRAVLHLVRSAHGAKLNGSPADGPPIDPGVEKMGHH